MAAKKQLIFVIHRMNHGGLQNLLYHVITNLDKHLFERYLICFYKDEVSPYQFDPQIKIKYLWQKSQADNKIDQIIGTIYRLKRVLRSFPPRSIILPFMGRPTSIYTVLTQLGTSPKKKIISNFQTSESVFLPLNIKNPIQRYVEKLLLKISCEGIDKIIVPSKSLQLDISNLCNETLDKFHIIPNPIDLVKIRRLSTKSSEIGIVSEDKTVFIHVGRFEFEKNHHLLIRSAEILKQRQVPFVLLCVGSGSQKENIEKWIKDAQLEKYVILLDAIENQYALISKSRALLLTSHYDSSPMVLKEALACRTPVISVDCPFGPADILGQGRYGILIPTDDPNALADSMEEIARNDKLYENLRVLGYKRALHYDLKIVIKQWESLLMSQDV